MDCRIKETFVKAAAVVVAVVVTTAIAFSANPNPGIAPLNSNPHGASYAQWGAAWWQWVFSLAAFPPDGLPNPLFTDGTVDCSFGQSGHVWFLAGRICFTCAPVTTTANRNCTVPTGTALFLPILNGEADNVAVFPPLPSIS